MRITGLNRSLIAVVLCILIGSLPGLASGSTNYVPVEGSPADNAETELQDGTPPTVDAPAQRASDSPQLLEDDEIDRLDQRNGEPDQTIAGGALSNLHLTYIVIALAAAVLVLVLK